MEKSRGGIQLPVCGQRGWEKRVVDPDFWKFLASPEFVSDEELWALRYKLRRELIEFVRRRLLIQRQRRAQEDFMSAKEAVAGAVGLGLFCGIAPIWGFQIIVAAALAHRLSLTPQAWATPQ